MIDNRLNNRFQPQHIDTSAGRVLNALDVDHAEQIVESRRLER